jgi:hypothetical protein
VARGAAHAVMASAKLSLLADQDTPGISVFEEAFQIAKNHPLLPWVRTYLRKHKFSTVENGQLKGVLDLDFFPNIIIFPPNPTLLAKPTVQDFY